MNCIKCHRKLDDNSKFCCKCGTYNKDNFTKFDVDTNYKSPEVRNFNDVLMTSYVGTKDPEEQFEKLVREKFCIWACIFGIGYYVYKKMYYIALNMFLVVALISMIFGYNIILMNGFFGIAFYPLYKMDIKKKINKIKLENKDASEEELIELVSKKGGMSKIGKGIIIIRTILISALPVAIIVINFIIFVRDRFN